MADRGLEVDEARVRDLESKVGHTESVLGAQAVEYQLIY